MPATLNVTTGVPGRNTHFRQDRLVLIARRRRPYVHQRNVRRVNRRLRVSRQNFVSRRRVR